MHHEDRAGVNALHPRRRPHRATAACRPPSSCAPTGSARSILPSSAAPPTSWCSRGPTTRSAAPCWRRRSAARVLDARRSTQLVTATGAADGRALRLHVLRSDAAPAAGDRARRLSRASRSPPSARRRDRRVASCRRRPSRRSTDERLVPAAASRRACTTTFSSAWRPSARCFGHPGTKGDASENGLARASATPICRSATRRRRRTSSTARARSATRSTSWCSIGSIRHSFSTTRGRPSSPPRASTPCSKQKRVRSRKSVRVPDSRGDWRRWSGSPWRLGSRGDVKPNGLRSGAR